MAFSPKGGYKKELIESNRQIANIIDLNKCMGCQTCTVACKNLWTDRPGTEHMRWMNVTTYPGAGYPRDYEKMGGGWQGDGDGASPGKLTNMSDVGDNFQFNHDEVYYQGKGQSVHLKPTTAIGGEDPKWGYNWDEDEGGGQWPNPYYFYLPRKCYHCSNPPCVSACTHNALYKREEDGIVLLDQDRCNGDRFCIEACPYKAIYYNPETQTSEKCIMCYPRIELGIAPACDRQCPGRTRAFGYSDDKESQVYKLITQYKVALPLHPEYGTEPNVYYIPPFETTRAFAEDGSITNEGRIELAVLEELFGKDVGPAIKILRAERQKMRDGTGSEVMDLLISKNFYDRFAEFTKDPV